MTDFTLYPNFERSEFECHCGCGKANMSHVFMLKLQRLRTTLDRPLKITSGFRCEAHNKAIGGKKNSAHLLGCAADIACSMEKAYKILRLAMHDDFTGFGIYQKGPLKKRFLHIDDVRTSDHPDIPRPRIFTY